MEEALFNPKFGYYNQKQPFGKKGDFITAPEISQTFGELIAIYFFHIWQSHFPKQKISLLEMGAGNGVLMNDILRTFKKVGFISEIEINIIEKSPKLKKIQKEKLQGFPIIWWNEFADFTSKNNKPIFFIANELFDCFAINQFIHINNTWHEKLVTCDKNGKLQFCLSQNPVVIDQKNISNQTQQFPDQAILEMAPQAKNLMEEISTEINKNKGMSIIIDYGYIENKLTSTLQAVKNNQHCDILENAGSCDISALVDFGLLEKISKKNNLQTSLISQREFLQSLGIETRLKYLTENCTEEKKIEITSAINRLIDKNQMGELFKVLIFWQND